MGRSADTSWRDGWLLASKCSPLTPAWRSRSRLGSCPRRRGFTRAMTHRLASWTRATALDRRRKEVIGRGRIACDRDGSHPADRAWGNILGHDRPPDSGPCQSEPTGQSQETRLVRSDRAGGGTLSLPAPMRTCPSAPVARAEGGAKRPLAPLCFLCSLLRVVQTALCYGRG